jgi:hypothetical protein
VALTADSATPIASTRASVVLTEQVLYFGERFFDRVDIRGVVRQVQELAVPLHDQFS